MTQRILTFLRGTATVCALALASSLAQAQLSIEITGAGTNRMPVAVASFEGEQALPRAVTDVVRADLERSGLFKLVELGPSPMGADAPPDFGRVRSRGADAFAVGTVAPSGSGRYQVQFRLFDAAKQVSLGSQAMVMAPNQYRTTGHRIADFIYEKLTGEPGVFSTRIAYVLKSGPRYELQIADADGSNAQTALASASRSSRRPGRRTAAPRLCVLRGQEAGGLRAFAGHRSA
jgi:TolB protein